MTELAVVLALGLAVWALVRASRLERRLDELRAELARLRVGERAGVPEATLPAEESLAPPEETPTIWPEDVPVVVSPAPARPRGPSLWDPEYSRARISVIGGVLVLGGLAFTLRELGAPSWTGLLAVFAFGGLLFLNARRVPWPVSGALRGLGYGVTALGLGSVTQSLPDAWGPAVVMLGLLALSAGLLWDGLRRREPLLGALAVLGAGLSVWMLTDDLGRASVLAAGAVLLLAGVAVSGRAPGQVKTSGEPEGTNRAALALTLGVSGLVPLGWLIASASHTDPELLFESEGNYALEVLALGGAGGIVPGLLVWLAFSALALAPALALLMRRVEEEETRPRPPVPALAARATLGPQVLVAAAVGTALAERGRTDPLVGVLSLVILALLALTARYAWGRRLVTGEDTAPPLTGTLAGSLTAAASGVAGAAVLGLLGARTQPAAIAGVALALLLVGLSARSRGWLTAGAGGLGLSAVWGASLAGTDLTGTRWDALLGALPAGIAVLGALRVARDPWATSPRPNPNPDGTPSTPTPRLTAPLLAGGGSLLAVAALQTGSDDLLWLAVAALSAGLWALRARGRADTPPTPPRRAAFWALAPGAAVGALLLVGTADGSGGTAFTSCLVALVAAGSLLGTARRAGGGARAVAEGAGLLVLALTLSRVSLTWLPGVGVPGALALTAALTVPLRLAWGWSRLDVGLGLGLLAALVVLLAAPLGGSSPLPVELGLSGAFVASLLDPLSGTLTVPALGALLLSLVWALTRTAGGLRTRTLNSLPAEDAAPQRPHVQALWLAALLLVGLLSLGARLDPAAEVGWPWLTLSSLAVLGVGLGACVGARRTGEPPRLLWDTGLGLIVAAGLKGVLLDAPEVPNTGAAVGVAVLVTGLSLLAVAILAPRPPGSAPALGEAADQPEG
ncbi:hypothetical protein V3W47_11915 [Deinococcus sp. YIM 134068]|uniref:hypothetical protein n=1 Tax=Deinococcus lichenicola TaxID=3118910 RepID=UPI002F947F00